MKKITSDWSTTVTMTDEEARGICNLGQGSKCCVFLVMGDGFECIRMNPSFSLTIINRLKKGTMTSKGEGGWKGCAWAGEI